MWTSSKPYWQDIWAVSQLEGSHGVVLGEGSKRKDESWRRFEVFKPSKTTLYTRWCSRLASDSRHPSERKRLRTERITRGGVHCTFGSYARFLILHTEVTLSGKRDKRDNWLEKEAWKHFLEENIFKFPQRFFEIAKCNIFSFFQSRHD